MKYPFILFFREDKYNYVDLIIKENADKLNCTIHIINKKEQLSNFYKQIYPLLIIFDNDENEYNNILSYFGESMTNRIILLNNLSDIDGFNELVNIKFINICSLDRELTRPIFSNI